MKKDFLQGISKENKKEFLTKLQSGKFILLPPYEPQKEVTFDLIPGTDLFLCKEDGRKLTENEIYSLPGYRMSLHLVDKTAQVRHEEPPSSIILVPCMEHEYLDSLLKNKSDVVITFDETDEKKPFRSKDNSYSFKDLKRINSESPEVVFLMDEKTKLKYLECLEKWC